MRHSKTCLGLLAALVTLGISTNAAAQTPVSYHGHLQVDGNKIRNQHGEVVALSGTSLFWSNNGWGGEDFYNAAVVNSLAQNWNANIIRAAIGVEGGGGFADDPEGNLAKARRVIDAALAAGIYVVVDFHSHDAPAYWSQARDFFNTLASQYGGYDNVLFEIFNEPVYQDWSSGVKPYAEDIINLIRLHSNNLIIVGTPRWCQSVVDASKDPITSDPAGNVCYGLHYYANEHGQWLRDAASEAMYQHGQIPLFVSEWGATNANGDGPVNHDESWAWAQFNKQHGLSNCAWSTNRKWESSSHLQEWASADGNWPDGDIKESGLLTREIVTWFNGESPVCTPVAINLPTTVIEAESYCSMSGIQVEPCGEGGSNVGYFDAGDWVSYKAIAAVGGTYQLRLRLAAQDADKQVVFEGPSGNTTINVPHTGGWQIWDEVTVDVVLPASTEFDFRLTTPTGGLNVNWIEFSASGLNTPPEAEAGDPIEIVLPASTTTLQGSGTDADGDPLTFSWSQLSGPSTATIGTPTSPMTTVSNLVLGTYTFRLTVDDGTDDDSDEVAVTVSDGSSFELLIQAEDYDEMSGVQTEPCYDEGGGLNVGWIDPGDWMAYHGISLPTAGTYTIEYRVASQNGGGTIQFERQGGSPVYGSIPVPSTGAWQNWKTISHDLTLPAGVQNLALAAPSGGYNINWLRITKGGLATYSLATSTNGSCSGSIVLDPPGGTYPPGTAVTATAAPDPGCRFAAWSGDASGSANPLTVVMDRNQSIGAEFVPDGTTYTLTTDTTGDGSGSILLDPAGGTYPEHATVRARAEAAPGSTFVGWSGDVSGSNPEVDVYMDGHKSIIAEFALEGCWEVLIQAEDYCQMSGIQTEPCQDDGGGLDVGWLDPGDWMIYCGIDIPASGTYTVDYRVASQSGGGRLQLERAGGSPVFGSLAVPSTGAWQNWTTISHTVDLAAGVQDIAIAAPAGGFNLNWFRITDCGGPVCGDGQCTGGENCNTCPEDCGQCSNPIEQVKLAWNLGNALDNGGPDDSPSYWNSGSCGASAHDPCNEGANAGSPTLMWAVKASGFDTVRIPITWHLYMDSGDTASIRPEFLNRIEQVVHYALDAGLQVIINIHHDNAWLFGDGCWTEFGCARGGSDRTAKFRNVWTQVANRFEGFDDRVIFQAMNEPRFQGCCNEWNGGTAPGHAYIAKLNKAFLEAVRGTGGNNASRSLLLVPYGANAVLGAQEFSKNLLNAPDRPGGIYIFDSVSDANVGVAVHMYYPWSVVTRAESFTQSHKAEVANQMSNVRSWFTRGDGYQYPVMLTEFAIDFLASSGDDPGARDFDEYYVGTAHANNIKPVIWDSANTGVGGDATGIFYRSSGAMAGGRQTTLDAMKAAAGVTP